mgnify:CR=1 FL=1
MSLPHTDKRDLSAKQPARGCGVHIEQAWLCGHKHTKGTIRSMGRGLPAMRWRCVDCARAKAPS